MAVLRTGDIKKMTLKEAAAKKDELEKTMLELQGSGKVEKTKPVKQALARLNTHISQLKSKAQK